MIQTDSKICFGKPHIRGIPVDVIVGRFRAGESIGELAHDYHLDTGEIEEALRYWLTRNLKKPMHAEFEKGA